MCCQNVCEEYREHVFKTRGIDVLIDKITLQECEEAIGANMERQGPITVRVGDNKIRVSIDIRGIA